MAGRYKAYPEYKKSGINWIGSIPTLWKVVSLRHLISSVKNGSTATQTEQSATSVPVSRIETISTGHINMDKTGFVDPNSISESFKLDAGDLLLSHINSLSMVGNVAQVQPNDFLFHGMNLLRIIPKESISSKYLFWQLKSDYSRKLIESVAKPAINQASVSTESLKALQMLLPSIEEQQKIANFLDHETAKIDTLIAKQEKLIELLKEKRQAVISHAVTKGLNPDAPMKDSGVEWLGEVPEHWAVVKCGYLGRLFGSEAISDDLISDNGDVPFVKVSTLSLDSFDLAEKSFFVDCSKVPMSKAKSNYVVFPKRGAAIFTNKVNIVKDKSFIDPNLMGWELDGNVLPEYVAFMLKLRGLSDIADVSTVPQINNKHIEPMKFPLPPITEQKEILESLSGQVTNLNLLVQKASEAIELMKERKTALISAAVTGKIDVRDWEVGDKWNG